MTTHTRQQSRETIGWDLLEAIDNRMLARGVAIDGEKPDPFIRLEVLSGTVQRDCSAYVQYENSVLDKIDVSFIGEMRSSDLAEMLEDRFRDWHPLVRPDHKHVIKLDGSLKTGHSVHIGPAAPAMLVIYGRIQALLAKKIADFRYRERAQNSSLSDWDGRCLRTLETLAGRFDLRVDSIVRDATSRSAWPF